MGDVFVNKLPVPNVLLDLLDRGLWRHPGEDIIATLIPYIKEPLVFLPSLDEMRRESPWNLAIDARVASVFAVVIGSQLPAPAVLPWLDVEQSFFIAVNRIAGDDIAIALDYRTSYTDPRVVASDWFSRPKAGVIWREVAPTFSAFVQELGLLI